MRGRLSVSTGVAAAAVIAGIAWADDESDRRDLISKIDGKLDYAASELSGLESKSDASDVNDALAYVREVEGFVSELSNKKGSDSRAGEIASRYPDYIRNFRDAAGYLTKLKLGQRLADGAGDQCRADESDLQTLIRNYVGDPDRYAQEALQKLPEKGNAYKSKWADKLSAWERHHREMASHASYARFSVSDGRWSNVSSNFASSASNVGNHWMKAYEDAARSCERLVKGDKHPDIEKAVLDLSTYKTNTKSTYKALESDYRDWLKDIQKLRQFTVDDRDELRKAMCFMGEYVIDQKVTEIAERWASQISSSYGTAMGQADRLLARTATVEKRAPKSTPKLRDAIKAVQKSLESLSSYELKGSSNPKIRAKLEYGKKAHEDKQSSCTYKELAISSSHCRNEVRPGSSCRLDCVMASSTCTIVEIKPDSTEAQSEGQKQLSSYADGLQNWYTNDRAGLFRAYPDLQKCERPGSGPEGKGGKLDIATRLETYSFCPSSAADLGQALDPIQPDVNGDGD
jgi:hypothetical protein